MVLRQGVAQHAGRCPGVPGWAFDWLAANSRGHRSSCLGLFGASGFSVSCCHQQHHGTTQQQEPDWEQPEASDQLRQSIWHSDTDGSCQMCHSVKVASTDRPKANMWEPRKWFG
mmetsp:Transcript_727/g.1614  ORF Transcript_727/g.1614 Transcript_727/m.1614 type:complete len:114 (-) Transcript_727:22-363(-)